MTDMGLYVRTATITIATDNDLSDAVELHDGRLVGILMPAAFDAGNIGFQASMDGITYGIAVDAAGAPLVVTAPAATEFVAFSEELLAGAHFIKLSTSVAQLANRVFTLAVRA